MTVKIHGENLKLKQSYTWPYCVQNIQNEKTYDREIIVLRI